MAQRKRTIKTIAVAVIISALLVGMVGLSIFSAFQSYNQPAPVPQNPAPQNTTPFDVKVDASGPVQVTPN